jgi:hypothetical protein
MPPGRSAAIPAQAGNFTRSHAPRGNAARPLRGHSGTGRELDFDPLLSADVALLEKMTRSVGMSLKNLF